MASLISWKRLFQVRHYRTSTANRTSYFCNCVIFSAFINAQAEYLGNSRKMKISLPLEMSQTPIMEVLGSVEPSDTTNLEEFSSMLNKSIEEGKRKMKSGKRSRKESNSSNSDTDQNPKKTHFENILEDSIHLTLSKDTMLSVETQEMTGRILFWVNSCNVTYLWI